jgi:hypothetical protein
MSKGMRESRSIDQLETAKRQEVCQLLDWSVAAIGWLRQTGRAVKRDQEMEIFSGNRGSQLDKIAYAF